MKVKGLDMTPILTQHQFDLFGTVLCFPMRHILVIAAVHDKRATKSHGLDDFVMIESIDCGIIESEGKCVSSQAVDCPERVIV